MISWIQRHTAHIILAALVLTTLGTVFTVKIFGNLRTNLEELLPLESRSVKDLDEVGRRLPSIDNLALVIHSQDTDASKRFVVDMARELQAFPKDEVTSVQYRIDREVKFFQDRGLLFLDLKALRNIRTFIGKKIEYETILFNPLTIFREVEIPEPKLDLRLYQNRLGVGFESYTNFPGGFFATSDETKRAILIDVAGRAIGIDGVKRVKQRVVDAVAKLDPTSYAPDLTVHYTGTVQEMLEEQQALIEDLVLSTVVVVTLVALAMLFFFQAFLPSVALVTALVWSTLWTFGLAYFTVGYLNANSAFLGSIVLGNGINFGIILLARYLEERRRGRQHHKALRIAMATTWRPTLTAALAAGVSYGSLLLTNFRGFSQFGLIGLMGMGLCWIGSFVVLPALLSWLNHWGWLNVKPRQRGAYVAKSLAFLVARFPKAVALGSIALTVLSVSILSQANPHELLETNLENLRSKDSIEFGAAKHSQTLNEIFQRFLTPLVMLTSSKENAQSIAARLKVLKKNQGENSPIVNVQTIDDFVPPLQGMKILEIKKIQNMFTPKVRSLLGKADLKQAQAFFAPEVDRTFSVNDLPELIRTKFTEKNGQIGHLVLVEPTLSKTIWKGENLRNFIRGLREEADAVEPGTPLAGGMAITSDLLESISEGGPKATALALGAVIFLVILLFRKPQSITLALTALLVGVAWFGAIIVAFDIKINFLNFVALPITFGIGLDYGINVFQRYQNRRSGGIIEVVRETGGAVGFCSLTTMIGYSSLLMASNQGFVSFGLLSITSEITCAAAALLALPALLESLRKQG